MWYFKTPGWNHWWMLIALTCDPDFSGNIHTATGRSIIGGRIGT